MKRLLIGLLLLGATAYAQPPPTVTITGDGAATVVSVGTQGPAGANIPAGGAEGRIAAKVGGGFGWSGATWNTGLNYTFDLPILGPTGCSSIPFGFTGRTTTGLCSSAADTANIYTAGVNRIRFNTTDIRTEMPLVIDTNLSGTATLGAELVTNGAFTSDLSGWTATGWTWIAGTAKHDAGNTSALSQDVTVTSGQTYHLTWVMSGRTAGSITVTLGAVTVLSAQTTNQTYNVTAVAGATGPVALAFTPTSDFDGALDAVSAKVVTASNAGATLLDSIDGTIAEIRGTSTGGNLAIAASGLRMLTTGVSNTGAGADALAADTTGSENTAFGRRALYSNTTGSGNTAQGISSMNNNTTGTYNVAQGRATLYSNTIGSYNAGVGYQALYSNTTGSQNVAIGSLAFFSGTSGNNATAVGANALYLATGNNNTAIGYQSGHTSGSTPSAANAVTTSASLTFVGFQSGLGSPTQRANATCIGYQCYVDADNTVVLGDENVTSIVASADGGATVTAGGYAIAGDTLWIRDGAATWQAGIDVSTAVDQTIKGSDSTSSTVKGGNMTLRAGAGTAGNAEGGHLILAGGANAGSGSPGVVRIEDGGTKPTCAAGIRSAVWYDAGAAGVADTFEVCRKDAANAYAWVTLF